MTWRAAMQTALYGEHGFYTRGAGPAAHYRTAALMPSFAGAVLTLLRMVDDALGRPDPLDFIDVAAGGGELVGEIARSAPPELRPRLRCHAVELGAHSQTSGSVAWHRELPDGITGLLFANEWLDNVPLDVVEHTVTGPRLVEVRVADGTERHGPRPTAGDLGWLADWWPEAELGSRGEIGAPRCAAWAEAVAHLARGVAVAVDYAHTRDDRPPLGSLTGYRDGRVVPAVPDGSCDLTAHVALDACAAAGAAAGATATLLTTQRRALKALGVSGDRPAISGASADPRGYLLALRRAGEEAELIDPGGLGGFTWLVQARSVAIPAALTETGGPFLS